MIEIADASGDRDGVERSLLDLLDAQATALGHAFAPDTYSLIATADGRMIGGAQYMLNFGWCFLKLLAVAPEWRGHGVGSQLIAALEAQIGAAHARGIWLDTFGFQAAPFYLRHGFAEIARLPGPVPAEDRIIMKKHLGDDA